MEVVDDVLEHLVHQRVQGIERTDQEEHSRWVDRGLFDDAVHRNRKPEHVHSLLLRDGLRFRIVYVIILP